MSTSLVYVLPSIMFGQMLAARKATRPHTSTPTPQTSTNPEIQPEPYPQP